MPASKDTLEEKRQRLRRERLERECAKLDIAIEQAAAEEFFAGEAQWPEYWATVAE